MNFGELCNICDTRYYVLMIYGTPIGRVDTTIDTERDRDWRLRVEYADYEVLHVQPIIYDDGEPALEVELNA